MPRETHTQSGRTKLQCPRCGQEHLARIARRGFLRNHIFPIFGFYPWQCAICGKSYLLRKRSSGYRRNGPVEAPRVEHAPGDGKLRVG